MSLSQTLHLIALPHPHNNHRPKLVKPLGLFWVAVISIVFPLLFNNQAQPQILGYTSSITEQQIVDLTNQRRQKNNLQPLKTNPQLSQAAMAKANDMFQYDYWAHVSPSGTEPWDFISKSGYQYLYAGENLARDFSDAESVIVAWMASPTHRDNLLNTNYQEIGVAVVTGELDGVTTTLIVQEFGKPRLAISQVSGQATTSLNTVDQATAQTQPVLDETAQENQLTTESDTMVIQQNNTHSQPQPSVSPLDISKSWTLAIAALLIMVLLIDAVYIIRHKIIRVSGRTIAHLSFIVMIIVAIISTQPGFIL